MKTDETFLKSIQTSPEPEFKGIAGTTLINHRIRTMLSLTCEEYCAMQMLDQSSNAKDIAPPPTEKRCWEYLGMEVSHVQTLISRLVGKNLLMLNRDGKFTIAPRWRKYIAKASEGFEQLYELFRKKGNRAEANRHYLSLLNELTAEEIQSKASIYMKYVYQNKIEWKFQIGLDNFLDPKTAKYNDYYPTQQESTGTRGKIS